MADTAGLWPPTPRGLLPRLGRGWRLLGTALSFFLFGLGGLGLALIVFPLMGMVVREKEARRRTFRRTVTGAFLWFREIMRALGVLRYRIVGKDLLVQGQGCLIVANHPCLIDVIFLLSVFRNADCVVKAALWKNPFTRGPLRGADYIPNHDPAWVVEECVRRLRAGRHLILFPEGTRTTPGKAAQFKRGAAFIALKAEACCLPVRLHCEPITLTKGLPWYRTPPERVQFSMRILTPLPTAPFLKTDSNPRSASAQVTDHLYQLLCREHDASHPTGDEGQTMEMADQNG